jgi:hypothetical protein
LGEGIAAHAAAGAAVTGTAATAFAHHLPQALLAVALLAFAAFAFLGALLADLLDALPEARSFLFAAFAPARGLLALFGLGGALGLAFEMGLDVRVGVLGS